MLLMLLALALALALLALQRLLLLYAKHPPTAS
jgi:hypothetical protein